MLYVRTCLYSTCITYTYIIGIISFIIPVVCVVCISIDVFFAGGSYNDMTIAIMVIVIIIKLHWYPCHDYCYHYHQRDHCDFYNDTRSARAAYYWPLNAY